MTTSTLAYIALGICAAGLLCRIGRWIRSDFAPDDVGRQAGDWSALAPDETRGSAVSRAATLPWVILRDVVLQAPLWRQDRVRWAAHMAVCWGFLLLIVLHALDDWTAPVLFADYVPTRNPFRWLRNFLAALVLAGVATAVIRHRADAFRQGRRSLADRLLPVLLAVVVLSGVLLESAQIVSPTLYQAMVDDYMGFDDPAEVAALGHFWTVEFGAVPGSLPPAKTGFDPAAGPDLHAGYCADCHSPPQSAFLAYPLSRALKPAALQMDALGFDRRLWQVHFLASCLALALLPFSKGFHLVATPANLVARATGPAAAQPPALRSLRRNLGMDACTHCGLCTRHCSVAPHYRVMGNTAILPSEKLQYLKRQRYGRTPPRETARLAEGSHVCTLCGRCTERCPSGIDLQDLWQASRQDLTQRGFGPFDRVRDADPDAAGPVYTVGFQGPEPLSLGLTQHPETFWACVQCTTCTSVCPVVAASEDPQRDLDLTPQQIMNLMRLQLTEQALQCRMLWDCVTCYKCQEHCPQDVKVADVLYELRNRAWQRRSAPAAEPPTDDNRDAAATDSGTENHAA